MNAVELASDAVIEIQKDFYARFPPHQNEKVYGFQCSSSIKPTQISTPESAINQIPQECVVRGDIRLIPFYGIKDAVKCVEGTVQRLKETKFKDLHERAHRGPDSKFYLERSGDGADLLCLSLYRNVTNSICSESKGN